MLFVLAVVEWNADSYSTRVGCYGGCGNIFPGADIGLLRHWRHHR